MTTSLISHPSQMYGTQLEQLVHQCVAIAGGNAQQEAAIPMLNSIYVLPEFARGRALAATPQRPQPAAKW